MGEKSYLGTPPPEVGGNLRRGLALPKVNVIDEAAPSGKDGQAPEVKLYTCAHDCLDTDGGFGYHFLLAGNSTGKAKRLFRLVESGGDPFGAPVDLYTAYALYHALPVKLVDFRATFGGVEVEVEERGQRADRWYTEKPGARDAAVKAVAKGYGIPRKA